jgi:hypothetical protein
MGECPRCHGQTHELPSGEMHCDDCELTYFINWPSYTTPNAEIAVLRNALHAMARHLLNRGQLPAYVLHESQSIVDYFVSQERQLIR